jgi:hypothetical protein
MLIFASNVFHKTQQTFYIINIKIYNEFITMIIIIKM